MTSTLLQQKALPSDTRLIHTHLLKTEKKQTKRREVSSNHNKYQQQNKMKKKKETNFLFIKSFSPPLLTQFTPLISWRFLNFVVESYDTAVKIAEPCFFFLFLCFCVFFVVLKDGESTKKQKKKERKKQRLKKKKNKKKAAKEENKQQRWDGRKASVSFGNDVKHRSRC